ncbi:MAG TPA: SgcJ/EcaC family oxidoreductase [Gemmatimonadaceae bacterium]|nr:SgcJ/EcaC family oxidoreductase [Gemmatimonadaceae bacterium]
MIRPTHAWITALSIAVLASCTTTDRPAADTVATAAGVAAPDAAADENAIRANDAAWFKAHNAHDVDAVVALYADDAVVSAPGQPAARGRAAIREVMQKDIQAVTQAGYTFVEGPNAEAGVSGDLGWISNTFTVKDGAGKTVESGKFVTLFARRDGKWQIIRDIWNSDSPPTPQT